MRRDREDAGFPTYRISNPALDCPKSANSQAVATTAERVLPTCLPKTAENTPDLQAVIEAWPNLPLAVKRDSGDRPHRTPE